MNKYKSTSLKRIFLDHNATTFPSAKVVSAIREFSTWGNPSSIHSSGRGARAVILKTRRAFSSYLGCSPGELSFTSGGSESNNTIIKGLLERLLERDLCTIITSSVEHPSVLKTLEALPETFNIIKVPVTVEKGFDYDFFEKALVNNSVGLVSVMCANNETGEIFDLVRLSKLIKEKEQEKKQRIYFHSDMVQSLGKKELSMKELPVDFASFSAHKFYSLQGTGVSFHRKGVGFTPLIEGGGQERGRRAGTENLLSIHAFGEQLESLSSLSEVSERIKSLRDHMEDEIKKRISGVEFLVSNRERLCNTSLMMIEGTHGETMLMNMDLLGFDISTGAACSSGNPEPSPVLLAMGFTAKEASKSLRVSLGWETTRDEVDAFVEALEVTIKKVRALYKA